MLGPNNVQLKAIEAILMKMRGDLIRIATEWSATPLKQLSDTADTLNGMLNWCQRTRIIELHLEREEAEAERQRRMDL